MRPEMITDMGQTAAAAATAAVILCFPQVRALCDRLRLGMLGRGVLVLLVAVLTRYACSKGEPPAVTDRLGNWLLWRNSQLVGDEAGVVAEAAQAAAISAYEAETGEIIAAVSNGMAWAGERYASMTNALETNAVEVVYVVLDAPRDLPGLVTNHNLAVTQERMAMTSPDRLSVWFRYSWAVSTSAEITVRCYLSSNVYADVLSVSNTYPVTETVTHAGGVSVDCYRYDFDVSGLGLGTNAMAMIPPYEATFGGPDGESFELPGSGLEVVAKVGSEGVSTNTGFTGWVNAWPEPFGTNLHIRVSGGVCCEALWHGTNISGEVEL